MKGRQGFGYGFPVFLFHLFTKFFVYLFRPFSSDHPSTQKRTYTYTHVIISPAIPDTITAGRVSTTFGDVSAFKSISLFRAIKLRSTKDSRHRPCFAVFVYPSSRRHFCGGGGHGDKEFPANTNVCFSNYIAGRFVCFIGTTAGYGNGKENGESSAYCSPPHHHRLHYTH